MTLQPADDDAEATIITDEPPAAAQPAPVALPPRSSCAPAPAGGLLHPEEEMEALARQKIILEVEVLKLQKKYYRDQKLRAHPNPASPSHWLMWQSCLLF